MPANLSSPANKFAPAMFSQDSAAPPDVHALRLLSEYQRARSAGGRDGSAWRYTEDQRALFKQMQAQALKRREEGRAAAGSAAEEENEDDNRQEAKRPDAKTRSARLESQRIDQQTASSLGYLKELLLPADSARKLE